MGQGSKAIGLGKNSPSPIGTARQLVSGGHCCISLIVQHVAAGPVVVFTAVIPTGGSSSMMHLPSLAAPW